MSSRSRRTLRVASLRLATLPFLLATLGLPAPVVAATPAIAVSAGSNHACAVLEDRTLVCWGANENGQLGNGGTTSRSTPVGVTGLGGVKAVAAGADHTCAIVGARSEVACWGSNTYGQLGSATERSRSLTPVTVAGLTGATALATGERHTCAIVGGGVVRCWGDNAAGQLGNPGVKGRSETPVAVTGIGRATVVAAGDAHTCIRLRDGTGRCWGANERGQLGRGTYTATRIPVFIPRAPNLASLAAGRFHTCGLFGNRSVRCWGWNVFGALGTGSTAVRSSTPTLVKGLAGVRSLDAGEGLTCAVLADGGVRCWGPNDFGGVGDGTTEDRATPVAVEGLSDATAVTVGRAFACALRTGGAIACWGQNAKGQLGDGTTEDRTGPVALAL